jgi:hypothetical protein
MAPGNTSPTYGDFFYTKAEPGGYIQHFDVECESID